MSSEPDERRPVSETPTSRRDEDPSRGAGLMRAIPQAAIRRPLGTAALAAIVLVLGVFSTGRLPVNLLPEVVYPLIRVSVNYPGVAPEVIEEQLTRPLERQLAATENLVLMASDVSEGRTNLDLVFEYGTDLDTALQDASRLLERGRTELPADAEPARLRKWDPGDSAVFQAGFSSVTRSPRDVRDWVENALVPQLQSVPGVAGVSAVGGQIREMRVMPDPQRLAAYGLSLQQIAQRLQEENRNIAAGAVTSASLDVLARTDGRFASAADIEQVLLPLPGGGSVRLSDVAEVQDAFRDQRVFVRLDGVPATQLSVVKQPDANTVEVIDGITARLRELEASGFIPEDMRWRTTRDASFFVRGSVAAVASSALLGSVLALLVALAFLGSLRKGLIVALAIPVSVLATLVLMGAGGLTLNVMSLGGLALGVGLLLDNAIVMLENIGRHQNRLGKAPEQAASDGADEVASAITAGTLTNLAAVTPFLLVIGFAALLFRELIVTISFAVVASLLVALSLVPMLAARIERLGWRSGLVNSRAFRWFDGRVLALAEAYGRALGQVLRWRWAVVGASSAALAAAVLLLGQLGSEFLPQLDNGELRLQLTLPRGATPEQTDRAARQIEDAVRELPHVQSVFTVAGGQLFGGVLSERGGRALFEVRLDPARERPLWPAAEWAVHAREHLAAQDIPGARIRVQPPSVRGLNFSVSGADLDLLLVGPDMDTVRAQGRRAVQLIGDVPGLENVELRAAERTPQLSVRVDRQRAAALGVSVDRAGAALRDALSGSTPTRFATGQFEYDVRVSLPRSAVGSVEDIGAVVVANGDGGIVRLADVATLEVEEGPAEIERHNQLRVQRITASFNTGARDAGAIVGDVRERLQALDGEHGLALIFAGQAEAIAENRRETAMVVALAAFLVFAVLVVQYERLSNPLVIMLTAPFALIGVALLLRATGTVMSAPALLGLILLTGIVVNNAILLVEYIERGLRRGLALTAAVVDAGRIRLRPILMTVLTTVCGMLPLALGMGSGAELMRPLAIAVIGGLAVSTLVTLFLAPCLFVIARGAGDRLGAWLSGGRALPQA